MWPEPHRAGVATVKEEHGRKLEGQFASELIFGPHLSISEHPATHLSSLAFRMEYRPNGAQLGQIVRPRLFAGWHQELLRVGPLHIFRILVR